MPTQICFSATLQASYQHNRAALAPNMPTNCGSRDLGTKGGVRTDVHARALRDDGSVIAGLYAAGSVSAPMMGHTYTGPGGTIGPAMTIGYLAALHIAAAALPVTSSTA